MTACRVLYFPAMPTFDFRCRRCDRVFEHARPMGSRAHPACPHCGNKRTEKLFSPPSVQFRGAGFYATDSRSPGTQPPRTSPPKKQDGATAAGAAPGGAASSPAPEPKKTV